jgi:TPR repeat protein
MYFQGEGVPENYAEAMKWWTKAAEQGDANDRYFVGAMSLNITPDLPGEPIRDDFVTAYMWLSLAKTEGHKNAATTLDRIKKQMTPAQITKAQELAAEM